MDGPSIKRLRQMLGINQSDFAQTLGMSQSYLSYIEKGTRPAPANIELLIRSHYRLSIRAYITKLEQQIALLKTIR